MRVLVVGEGPHDIGLADYWDQRQKKYVELPGWLHGALEKLNRSATPLEIVVASKTEIALTDQQRRKNMPLPKGHGLRALAALFRAMAGEYDAVVFMVDSDTKDDAEWRKHKELIREGFDRGPSLPARVICLPKCASESWLLADPTGWTTLGLGDVSILPPHPEASWGDRDDPNGHHPKHDFERARQAAKLVGDGRTVRVSVMGASEPEAILKACPLSFGDFWQECAAAGISDFPCSEPAE